MTINQTPYNQIFCENLLKQYLPNVICLEYKMMELDTSDQNIAAFALCCDPFRGRHTNQKSKYLYISFPSQS